MLLPSISQDLGADYKFCVAGAILMLERASAGYLRSVRCKEAAEIHSALLPPRKMHYLVNPLPF